MSVGLTLVGLAAASGCRQTPTRTRIDLTAYAVGAGAREHYTEFRRAHYRLSPGGLIELVLQAERPSTVDPTQTINQVLYVKMFWNPQPGRSYVEATQINAHVQFAMLTPPTGVRFDGSAFVTYKLDEKTGKLTGWIESGSLQPRFRMGEAVEPFDSATFEGTFVAEDRPREVVQTAQMLEAQFRPSKPGTPGAITTFPSR
jgi:hypothetical protein